MFDFLNFFKKKIQEFNTKINSNKKLKKIFIKIKQIKEILTSEPVYQVTEKELTDTITYCYKKGLSDAQILEVFNSPPYKWTQVINKIEDQNLADLNEIYETRDYDNNYYNDNHYDEYNSEADIRDVNLSLPDNSISHEYDSTSLSYTDSSLQESHDSSYPQNKNPVDINNLDLTYKGALERKKFISFLIKGYCNSQEFLQMLCARFPEYASEIISYVRSYTVDISVTSKESVKRTKKIKK